MKLLIAGVTMGLLFAGAPVWADPWRNESGHAMREARWEHYGKRRHPRSERRHWQPERYGRHGDRHHRSFGRRYYYEAPATRHYYYYRDYSYGYPEAGAYIQTPDVYFSWSY